jgi:sugar lactone lactonase YvrE
MTARLELIIESQALLGECPCWHQEKQLLYWVDIFKKQLHIYQPTTKIDRTIELEEFIGCVVPRKSGGVVVALQTGFAALELETEKINFLDRPENHPRSNRFNDGKCDPSGHFLAGTMALDETPNAGALYSLDGNLKIKQLLDELSISNGMGWSPDYSTMYLIDSPTKNVFAFDYDADTGNISNRRIVVTIPDELRGYPDGMTIDREGTIWVALWAGFKVTRWNPHTGKLLQSISIPAPHVTSCTFGGLNMNELYITTARKDMDEAALAQYPQAGSVFRLKTDVIGMKAFEFMG